MSSKQSEFKAALRALVEEQRRGLSAHPTPEELISYHGSELSVEEEKHVQDHLVLCRECTALLLDLAAFPALDQEGARQLSDAEVAAAWRALQPQLRRQEAPGISAPSWWQRFSEGFSLVRLSYALAASLLVVSLGLGAWIVSLWRENQRLAAGFNEQLAEQERAVTAATKSLEEARQRLEEASSRSEQYETQIAELRQTVDELSQPQINTPVTDLYPRDYIRGQEGAVKTVAVPSGANFFTLILNIAGQPSHPEYALEILDQGGQVIWQGRGLQKSPYNNFTVTLPRRSFSAGQYRIKLYGLRGTRRELVEEYALHIRYQ